VADWLGAISKDEYLKHYHKRSDVESTISMIKAKFGDHVRSKTDRAVANEALCNVLCQYICFLIQSTYELGVEATSWGEETATVSVIAETIETDPAEMWAWV
jgi:hypothetical protein